MSSPQNSPRSGGSSNMSGSFQRAQVVDATSYELHEDESTDDITTDVKRRAQGFFDTIKQKTSMFRQNLTTQAWLYILNVIFSVMVLFGCAAALLYEAFNNQYRDSTVGEDYGLNMCSFQYWRIYLTTSASYSMSDLMIGCFFSLWYAFRAVRHEKEALLVVFSLCVLGVVGRAFYFSFVTAYYWVTGLDLLTMQIFLCLGSVGLLIAVAQTWRVGRSFGWRMYTRGVASVADIGRMNKLKTLDAAAKLDLFLTINAFNTFFFFSPDRAIRYVGFGFTAVTAIFLLAIPVMIKRQMFFVAYVFAVFGLVLPAFYVFLLYNIFKQPVDHCFEIELTNCALESNISQISRTFNYTAFPTINDNNTGCIDCRNETTFSPNRLCWSNLMPSVSTDPLTNITTYDNTLVLNDGNETARALFLNECLDQAATRIDECCREFGRCELKRKLVDSNAPMAVFVVICSMLARLATMFFGMQQARMMDAPSVEEMIKRGQRSVTSALSFQFMGSQSPPSTARYRNMGDHEMDNETSRNHNHDEDEFIINNKNNKVGNNSNLMRYQQEQEEKFGGGSSPSKHVLRDGHDDDHDVSAPPVVKAKGGKKKKDVIESKPDDMPTPRYEVKFAE